MRAMGHRDWSKGVVLPCSGERDRMKAIRRGFAVLFMAVALALVAVPVLGCSGQEGNSESQAQSSADAQSKPAVESLQSSNSTEAVDESGVYVVSLGFVGDICLADNYTPMEHLASLGSTDITDGIDKRFVEKMNAVDLMWVNNEFVYSDRGEPLPGKMYTFCGATKNVSYLHDLGVDVAGLANNHVFDYGEESFLDTLDTLKDAGIPYVGAGRDFAEASAPLYLEVDGLKIAYVAASRAEYEIYTLEATDDSPGIMWCYENDKFLDEIREAAANADFVIALPHWGVEHSTELEDVQISSAHEYIDAGADAVIGAHPHILQGIEYYKGKPIMYSLGNFWFDDYDIDTLLAELRSTGTRGADGQIDMDKAAVALVLHPGTQSGVFTAWSEGDDERSRIFRYLEDISDEKVSISGEGIVSPSA